MDQALPADMPITLVIKAPNQRMADQTVDCMLGWTIRKLKQHLENVYPSKPKHNEQRLIYSGKLLQDHLTLKEILRQYEGNEEPAKHTVHLVCSRSPEPSPSSTSNVSVDQRKSHTPEGTSPSSTAAGSTIVQPPVQQQSQGTDGLRFRGVTNPTVAPTTSGFGPTHTGFLPQSGQANNFGMYTAAHTTYGGTLSSPAGYNPDQYSWFMQQQQQAYAQYMMQYMQYYQSMYYPGQPLNHQMMSASSTQVEHQQQQPQPQPAQQPAAAPARPNNDANNMPRMNAQGGVDQEDDNDLEPRDWLHHVYFFMRFLTFMGFLIFYSSPTRFLLVSSASIAIYFLQKIRRHMQQIQEAQEQERRQLEEEQQRQQERNDEETEANGAMNADGNAQQEPQDQMPRTEAADGHEAPQATTTAETGAAAVDQAEALREEGHWFTRAFVFVCMTVQAFFTSLLPTPPELLDAN
ncbi:homocysteine-responsive endoplasmic reticulum-resident ubiquitin-like domain member 2 protein [Plakobranchus ocellatus]|uniref:Homocysteine-responsive endoplasmic reticulum-resident ubiquitin-like domain member 2 protein n=1 Tax=Plakobranchus ocellatus TaxID=259542 RepID=A0AAV4BZB6_9GAST|nr:homocysteine-responsive endoplasmic reticulum-resident ubiquitin-like domain member 2 protein [Plakobranchus ocellatus]